MAHDSRTQPAAIATTMRTRPGDGSRSRSFSSCPNTQISTVPVAPFSLVNVAAGSIGIPFRDYLFGTFLGLAPGTVLICVFGQELKDLLRDPSPGRVLVVVAIAAGWVLLSWAIQRFVSRRNAGA